MINVMAFDPSIVKTGWAVLACTNAWRKVRLVECGLIRPGKVGDDRLGNLGRAVDKVLTIGANAVIIEKASLPYTGKRINRLMFNRYVSAVEVCRNVAAKAVGINNVYAVYPQSWKQTQKKAATIAKANMIYHLDLQAKDNDKADAIMLGTWFVERMRVHPIPPAHLCNL